MKYCQQCGTKLPDEAKFCRSCGAKIAPKVSAHTSDDGEGIVIDAPEEATVTISGDTKAPDSSGEFSVASWEGTEAEEPKEVQEPKRATVPPKKPEAPKMQEPPREEKPVEPEQVEPKKQSGGIFSIIWTFIKVMAIVLGIVFSAVIIRGFFETAPEAPKEEHTMQTDTNAQENTEIPADYSGNEAEANSTVNHSDEDELVFDSREDPESKEDPESNSGFGKIEDMPLPERAEFYEGLLERTEQYLQEELAKGADANQDEIRQLRKDIVMLRERLSQIKQ